MDELDVLYVHPDGHLNDLAVPAGAISSVNAAPGRKLGRYAFELLDDEVRAARVVAVDLHWAIALPGFARLVRHVRAVNPSAVIVAGGITAGHYPRDLLDAFPVDHVLQGDSEVGFAAIVSDVLAGRPVGDHPNVHARGRTPCLSRMRSADLDATDTISAGWFPTHGKLVDVPAGAHSQCRVVILARGCSYRCPNSYGSFACTFGGGVLFRSPASVVAQTALAAELGTEKIRYIASKLSMTVLRPQLEALARAGPFRFRQGASFFLCQPPGVAELELLERAFDCEVTVSAVPPAEHVPRLRSARLDAQEEAWKAVAAHVLRARRMRLHMCVTEPDLVERTRNDVLGGERPPKLMVFHADVWTLARPTEHDKAPLAQLADAMEPLWTFVAGRCLSPALASLLETFGWMDERGVEPGSLPEPEEPRRAFFRIVREGWERARLPVIAGLRFSVVPLRGGPGLERAAHGTFFSGASGVLPALRWKPPLGPFRELRHRATHRGHYLDADVELPDGTEYLAFVPHPPDGSPPDAGWLDAIGGHGLAVLDLRKARASGPVRLEVTVRVMEAGVALLAPDGEPLLRVRIDLGLFRVKPRVAV